MTATANSGPKFSWGKTSYLLSPPQGAPVPDPNSDAGPDVAYQGNGFLDPRFWFPKDKVTGYVGSVASHFPNPFLKSNSGIPTTLEANNVAANQHVVNGTAMTLAARSLGWETNVPILPFVSPQNSVNNGAATTAAGVLEFGFGFCTTTAVAATAGTITVPDSSIYFPGMPLVIGGAGNSAGTIPLLTTVIAVPTATTVTLNPNAVALAAITGAPVGLGNSWPSELNSPLPTAHMPFLAGGSGLFFDARQGIQRGLSITGAGGSAGGTFLVSGWDAYWQPMTDLVTVGAASTGYTTKTFKAIASVVPQFTDAFNYEVGTADLFGFAYRSLVWEDTRVFWAGAAMTTATGWVAAVQTSPATNLTGDVRGTIQLTSSGPGSGIGSTASNGTLSSNSLTGNRLEMGQFVSLAAMTLSNPFGAVPLFGVTQS